MVRKASSLYRFQRFAQNFYREGIAQGRSVSTPGDIYASNPRSRARRFFATEAIQAIHRRATSKVTRHHLKLFGCDDLEPHHSCAYRTMEEKKAIA